MTGIWPAVAVVAVLTGRMTRSVFSICPLPPDLLIMITELTDQGRDVARAAGTLKIDDDFRKQVLTERNRLVPVQIWKKGNLQEWPEDWDQKKKSHRHISNLYGLFPGNQISF